MSRARNGWVLPVSLLLALLLGLVPLPALRPKRPPGRLKAVVAVRWRPLLSSSSPRLASMQWLASPLMLPPRLLLHSRPSESPEDRPKAASSELRPKFQRAPAICSPVGSR